MLSFYRSRQNDPGSYCGSLSLSCLLGILGFLFATASLGAQEPPGNTPDPLLTAVSANNRVLVVDNLFFHSYVKDEYRIVLLHGNVHVQYDTTHIYADSVVLWYDYTESLHLMKGLEGKAYRYDYQVPNPFSGPRPTTPGINKQTPGMLGPGDPLEFYAEGNVKIIQKDGTFFCDQIYTHFKEQRGCLLSGEFFGESMINRKNHPLHFQCAAIKQICNELYTVEDASFTTCMHGIPHYDLHVRRSELQGGPARGVLSLIDPSIRYGKLPLPMPDSSFEIGRRWYFPVKSVKAGKSSRYGSYLLLGFEEDFDHLGSSLNSSLGIDNGFSGDAELDLLLSERRGIGWEPKLEYNSPDLYNGYLKGFYIVDQRDTDRGSRLIEEHKRGRIRTQNRIQLDELDNGLDLDLELSYITDRFFLDEYFEKELKADKEQETYLYLHKAEGSSAYSLMGRFRLNDFDTQNEYLPQGLWDLNAIPILLNRERSTDSTIQAQGLFYNHRVEVSQVRNRPDNNLTTNSDRLFRADYRNSLEAPFKISAVKITPFFRNQVSFFEKELGNAKPVGRAIESFGARAGFLMHHYSPFEWDLLNIHGLRNILEPGAEYSDNFSVNRESRELIPFDDLERGDRGNRAALTLRHRIQTRNRNPDSLPHDLYDGFFTLPFTPDRRLSPDRHRMQDMKFDMWVTPLFKEKHLWGISLNEEGDYDLANKRFRELNSTLVYAPTEDYLVNFGHRWIHRTYSYITSAARFLLTDKWEVEAGIQYNLVMHEWADRTFVLRRRAHQWLFEFIVEIDPGDNDKSMSVAFSPLAFFGKKQTRSIYDPMKGR